MSQKVHFGLKNVPKIKENKFYDLLKLMENYRNIFTAITIFAACQEEKETSL